jgi:uncharacterized protein YceK
MVDFPAQRWLSGCGSVRTDTASGHSPVWVEIDLDTPGDIG